MSSEGAVDRVIPELEKYRSFPRNLLPTRYEEFADGADTTIHILCEKVEDLLVKYEKAVALAEEAEEVGTVWRDRAEKAEWMMERLMQFMKFDANPVEEEEA